MEPFFQQLTLTSMYSYLRGQILVKDFRYQDIYPVSYTIEQSPNRYAPQALVNPGVANPTSK